jgi:hypothetical protein
LNPNGKQLANTSLPFENMGYRETRVEKTQREKLFISPALRYVSSSALEPQIKPPPPWFFANPAI